MRVSDADALPQIDSSVPRQCYQHGHETVFEISLADKQRSMLLSSNGATATITSAATQYARANKSAPVRTSSNRNVDRQVYARRILATNEIPIHSESPVALRRSQQSSGFTTDVAQRAQRQNFLVQAGRSYRATGRSRTLAAVEGVTIRKSNLSHHSPVGDQFLCIRVRCDHENAPVTVDVRLVVSIFLTGCEQCDRHVAPQ